MKYLLFLTYGLTLACVGVNVFNSPFTMLFLSILFIMAINLDVNKTYFCVTNSVTKEFSFWKLLKVIAIVVTFLITLLAVFLFVPKRAPVIVPMVHSAPTYII